ncbi:hypothetical protein QE152_g26920 [Popillia japonica]|uniref:Gag protein n=1 Tax=Popillia japonica TaxID=7064 RepID=A0AAW1JWK7_POPJA
MDKLRSVCIQKFDGNNFQLWKYQMEIIFAAEGLTDLVNGKTNFPAQVSEQKAWNENNAKAMLLISTSMEFSQLQTVVACKKTAEMWDRLKTIHEQRSSKLGVSAKAGYENSKYATSWKQINFTEANAHASYSGLSRYTVQPNRHPAPTNNQPQFKVEELFYQEDPYQDEAAALDYNYYYPEEYTYEIPQTEENTNDPPPEHVEEAENFRITASETTAEK